MDEAYYLGRKSRTPISEDSSPEDLFRSIVCLGLQIVFSSSILITTELINSLMEFSLDAVYELYSISREVPTSDKFLQEVIYIKPK